MPSLPYPIACHWACVDDDRLYIFGGYIQGKLSNKVAYLQSGSDHWVSVCPMEKGRIRGIACALDHFIYVIGGIGEGYMYHSLDRYDPTTNTWESVLSEIDLRISQYDNLTAFDGHLYYLGYSHRTNCPHYYDNIKQYDPIQNKFISSTANQEQLLRTVRFINTSKIRRSRGLIFRESTSAASTSDDQKQVKRPRQD